MGRDVQALARRNALRIAFIYVVVAILWIIFSDRLLAVMVASESEALTVMQTVKGGVFVLITGGLLYYLIWRKLLALYQQEAHVEHLNRVHRVLSDINGMLLRIRERSSLLDEACRIAVVHGGYAYSGVMRMNADGTALIPEAAAGRPASFADTLAERSFLQAHDHNPLWRLLHSPYPRVVQAASSGEKGSVWRDILLAPGFGALAIFPLQQGERMAGVMIFAATDPEAFTPDECRLLAEVAADTGLGLEYIESAEHAQWLATHDPLTALPNRNLIMDRLQQVLNGCRGKQQCTGTLVVNLHRFHHINDAFGRNVGDWVLRAVGGVIVRQIGDDGSVARLASDEFVVIFNRMDEPEEIEALTSRLLSAFPLRLEEGGRELYVSVRIGAAISPADGDNAEMLLEHAEIALHSGNRDEQNYCTFYGREVDEAMRRRHLISQELHEALERQEFKLLYQPIICLNSGQIAGMEALLRWDNRLLGKVGPAEFIPIAEESGHIDHLGKWVLHEGSRQHRELLDKGHHLTMTINIAARQLLGTDFAPLLAQVLAHYGDDRETSGLGLEITETDLLHDMEKAVDVLTTVRDHGVQVYLDDFGTGYSSLSYLNRLPVHKVKVDGSFVAGLPHDSGKVALVKSIIGMAHSLGLEVVAEGVENHDQVKMLSDLGCDAVQGYLFARPLSIVELEPLLGQVLGPGRSIV